MLFRKDITNTFIRRTEEADRKILFSETEHSHYNAKEKQMELSSNVLERFRLDNKTAVITGAAGNIGSHSAEAMAQAGANIAIVDLPVCLERSEKVAAGLAEKYGVKAKGYGCQLTDEKAVLEMFEQIENDFGSIDVVHNNAGVGGALTPDIDPWDHEHDMPHIDHWRQVLNINLVSIYIVAVTAAQMMKKEGHGGTIINTGSLAGQNINQGPLYQTQDDSSYGTAKAGVLYFTKHFASQVMKYGIRVNSISPGYCYSPGLHDGMDPEMLDVYRNSQPIGRMMTVEELQAAILFLASDASSYCVGTDLLVDGGHKAW